MSDYKGSKCLVCGEVFKTNDDIVVCPDCGTPYHRSCYIKEGKCINTALHENNQSWKPNIEEAQEDEGEQIACANCGHLNPQTGLFCLKCGNPLDSSTPNTPFGVDGIPPIFSMGANISENFEKITPDSDFDGVKIKDYSDYIGSNQLYFLANFFKFSKFKSKFSLNLPAMLFPEFYYFYRKMYFSGAIIFLIKILLQVPMLIYMGDVGILSDFIHLGLSKGTLETLTSIVNFTYYPILALCAFFTNWLYYKKAQRDIKQITSVSLSEEETKAKLINKGGVSRTNLLVSALMFFLLTIVSVIILSKI